MKTNKQTCKAVCLHIIEGDYCKIGKALLVTACLKCDLSLCALVLTFQTTPNHISETSMNHLQVRRNGIETESRGLKCECDLSNRERIL